MEKKSKTTVKKFGIPILAVAGAATLGAAFGPGLASADDSASTQDSSQASDINDQTAQTDNHTREDRGERGGKEGRGHRGPGKAMSALKDLGLDEETLKAGREEGKTLAQIAEANGISQDQLVQAIVKDMQENAPEGKEVDVDELTKRVTEMVTSLPGDHPFNGKGMEGHHAKLSSEDKAAFRAAIDSGNYDEAKAIIEKDIDAKLAAGEITQEEADEHKEHLAEKDFSERPEGKRGRMGDSQAEGKHQGPRDKKDHQEQDDDSNDTPGSQES